MRSGLLSRRWKIVLGSTEHTCNFKIFVFRSRFHINENNGITSEVHVKKGFFLLETYYLRYPVGGGGNERVCQISISLTLHYL